jgi:hypothetical protein
VETVRLLENQIKFAAYRNINKEPFPASKSVFSIVPPSQVETAALEGAPSETATWKPFIEIFICNSRHHL